MGAGDPETQLKNAEKLEMVLRSGALPAPITPSNESLIGPSLGADAIQKGAHRRARRSRASCSLFMIFYYRKAGFVADVAVLFNLLLQLAILASFSGTLTLPGIAGLALTIGMAVDANVLINERIREELRAGAALRAAVEAGYDKAFTAIVDGHVTIFISGLILAQYGTGPVKGFAVTLIIGIIASLFTGVFCTRLVFDWWVRGAKVKAAQRRRGVLRWSSSSPAKSMTSCASGSTGSRSACSSLSGRCCSSSIPGPNYGTDFKGGTEIEVAFTKAVDGGEIRHAVTKSGAFSEPDVVQVSDADAPVPLPDPRAGDQHGRRRRRRTRSRKALCLGVEGEDAEVPAERARHRGEVQRRRRQALRPLRHRPGPREAQAAARRRPVGQAARRGRTTRRS